MSFNLDIIWPLDGPPPSYEEGVEFYEKLSVGAETKSMATWFANCLTGSRRDVLARLELKPYSFAHMYEMIADDGEFPNGPDDWVSPDEMIEATQKFLSLIGNEDPDALALVECFINENRTRRAEFAVSYPRPRIVEGEDPFAVGLWRAQALSVLLDNLQGVIEAADACNKEGIDQVAFGYF